MIEFNNVTKVYENGTKALDNVSLRIEQGEFVFIVGASGAGKTTLTKLLMCEERLSSGTLNVNGYNLSRIPQRKIPFLRRTMGMVFQDFRLLPNMTVGENVAFAMRVIGEPKKVINTRVKNFLRLVGLSDKINDYPRQLSGGEKQRVALARALVNRPSVIIADEPTGNIDPIMSFDMIKLLLKINSLENMTVVVITHERDIVDAFNKRVITISDGCVISDKTGGMFE
ncbi:MAG: cell division ATP-binding protein FtsE [Ruminococcaceae bacterium]|nr:cell division ATP-binding protein FtsE [Oscillospiraceae bacterium]